MSELLTRFKREQERGRVANTCLFHGNSQRSNRDSAEGIAALIHGCDGSAALHPDCHIFDPVELDVKGLKVEHIATRKEGVESVESCLRYRSSEGGARTLLILDVDWMGADAQAALLETAEEPPASTYLLLTACHTANILPALLSRCRFYRIPPMSPDEARRQGAAAGVHGEAWDLLVAACGSPEAVLQLELGERKYLQEIQVAAATWIRQPKSGLGWLVMPEGGKLSEQRQALLVRLGAFLGWISHAYPSAEPARVAGLDHACSNIATAMGEISGQISPQLVLETLRLRLNLTR